MIKLRVCRPAMPTLNPTLGPIPRIVFMSRWLQLRPYLGLIVASGKAPSKLPRDAPPGLRDEH